MRSGFVSVVGRPNVGKSTLVNALVGAKVSITSPRVQTTRVPIKGVLHAEDAQVIFVDTPGIHKPRTLLGKRLNRQAYDQLDENDRTMVVLDATKSIGPGDEFVLSRSPASRLVVVNKIDRVGPDKLLPYLKKLSSYEAQGYYPVSARTGEGLDELRRELVALMPEGPAFFPENVVTDTPEAFWVAELVREELLGQFDEEIPHSIATAVTEWEWPHIRCEIYVERESQKGMVIGKGGEVLKQVGINVREQLDPGTYLELVVKVNKNWQRSAEALNRMGL